MKVAVVFGQFGDAADPVNLPHFRDRLAQAGVGTILIQHTDSQAAYDFNPDAYVGASLGAMSVCIMAGYRNPTRVKFVGGFQPSAWDPTGHNVNIPHDPEPITRAVNVPGNVAQALCFRNPIWAATGGLGHATYIASALNTRLEVIDRPDVHPGDFGEAQDIMVARVLEAIK